MDKEQIKAISESIPMEQRFSVEQIVSAAIESYKAELLKEVQGVQPELGEPVAWMHPEEGLSYENHYVGNIPLYTSDQLAAAQEEIERLKHSLKLEQQLSDSLKMAARMPGTGNYVDWIKTIRNSHDQLAKAEQRVAEVTALNPILEILDPARRLFIIANRLELKYLPIYADQPDPTYITKWVWEVRDQFGASVCEAHEWLYQAIDNAEKAISANGASS